MDLNEHIFEGWTAKDFVKELEPIFDMIMSGNTLHKPFKNRQEIKDWCKDNQPYYKKPIKEVNQYFINKANL